MTRSISRRTLIAGGASIVGIGTLAGVAAAIDTGALPGRSTLYRTLGLDGATGTIPPDEPGPRVTGDFISAARGGITTGWTVSYPPGSLDTDALPLVVVLHGVGADHRYAFAQLGLDRFLAAHVATGGAPFALASVDGGTSYWHPRSSGEDAGAMVLDEFVPLLAKRGLRTDRLGLLGWSMGGYGALRLASLLGPRRVAAVAAESPAMWRDWTHAAPGAFDDERDYDEQLLAGRQDALVGIAVRIDCGIGDGFYPDVKDYVAGFDHSPCGDFDPGGHDDAYWTRKAPAQLDFLGAALG